MELQKEIFICDDEKLHADLIMYYLRQAGITNKMHYFENGRDLIDHVHDLLSKIQMGNLVILLDIRLPGIDGVEVLRILKKLPASMNIPVVMVSTMDDPNNIQECRELGCAGYVSKPIDAPEFVRLMQKVLLNSSEP